MPIDFKNALTEWKKAKPLTLTKTGISEALRTIPANPAANDIPVLDKLQKTLEAAEANPKIKKEKKAYACIEEIHKYVKAHLDGVKKGRVEAVKSLKELYTAAHTFYEKDTALETLAALAPYEAKVGGHMRTYKSHSEEALIPAAQTSAIETGVTGMHDAVASMRNIVTPPKDPSKAPKIDHKKEYAAARQSFLNSLNQISSATKQLEAIK